MTALTSHLTEPGSETPAWVAVDGFPAHYDYLCCLLDYIPDRIYFKDRKGHFVLVSRAEAEYLGAKDPAEVIGRTDFDYFEPTLAQAAFDDEQQVMRAGNSITGQVEKKQLLDGRTGWALVAKIPLRDSDGKIIGSCGISKDITPLKDFEHALQASNLALATQTAKLEESLVELHKTHQELMATQQRLIEFEKVQMLTHLALGVAHEIRNPLGVIEMGVQFMAGKPAITQDEQLASVMRAMSDSVRQADIVISALTESARSSGVTVKSSDIAASVQRAVDMMSGSQPSPSLGS